MAVMAVFHVQNAQFPLVTAMVCIGDIYHLLNFFSFSRWLFIGLATLGLIVHRHRHPELQSPFKVNAQHIPGSQEPAGLPSLSLICSQLQHHMAMVAFRL